MRYPKTALLAIALLVVGMSCTSGVFPGGGDVSPASDLVGFWETRQMTLTEFACDPVDSPLVGIAASLATPPDSANSRTFYEFARPGDGVRLVAVHTCDIESTVCITVVQEADEENGMTLTQDFADSQLTILRTLSSDAEEPNAPPIDLIYNQEVVTTQEGDDIGTIHLSAETMVSTSGDIPAGALGVGSPEIAADESIACSQSSIREMTRASDPTEMGFTLVDSSGPKDTAPTILDDDHIFVVGDPLVTVVEYGDFECPGCGFFAREMLPAIRRDYVDTGRVRWVFRHYPLRSIHEHADIAAQASECADDQDRFWDYHDLLFENQAALTEADLEAYAAQLDMDQDTFNACLGAALKASSVQFDIDSGLELSVLATPTFFINDKAFVGVPPLEVFTAELDGAIAAAGG